MPVDHSIKDAVVDRTGKEGNAVALGSLLRGLCRFLREGAAQDDQGFPEKWLNRFGECVDSELFAALVSGEFDGASLGERRKTLIQISEQAIQLTSSDQSPRRSDRLSPVFNRIDLTTTTVTQNSYFHLQPLTATTNEERPPIFACRGDKSPQPEVETYRESLRAAVDELCRQIEWGNFDCVYTHFLNLIHRYAWCIPAEGQPDPPDVSLYDQSRVASAIAVCLHQHHASRQTLAEDAVVQAGQSCFVLLVGDVSGIQDYIFAISTTGAGGVARRLRARSFYVQMLSDTASLRALGKFGLPLANLLMASGGKFYALLPNLPDTVERLQALQNEFDGWLLKEFHGALSVNLAWTEMVNAEFADGYYGDVMSRLQAKLRTRKAQRLANALQNGAGWSSEFVRATQFEGEQVCKSCYRFPANKRSRNLARDAADDLCHQCYGQEGLGRRLTRARFLSFYEKSGGGYDCLGWKFKLSKSAPSGKPSLVVNLNEPHLEETRHLPATFRYLANHVKFDEQEGTPWTFSDIAAGRNLDEGAGETTTNLLGVLKADVDYLGQVFQEGLRREQPATGFDSLPRIAALSRQIDWFFAGWLEWLLKKKYETCYAVYSGGDDLLIVGPRAKTLELAREINKEFGEYVNNPQLTLSAGIAVVKPRLPIAHTVKTADAALDVAKESGRNRLCLLGDVVTWDKLESLRPEILSLAKIAQDKIAQDKWKVPSGFLYRLLHYAELYDLYRAGRWEGLRYHALLSYQIGRTVESGSALDQWARRLLQFPPQGDVKAILDHLRLITQWVLLERREKNRDDIG